MSRTADPVLAARARLATVTRWHPEDTRKIAAARRDLEVAHATRAVDNALNHQPPITHQQRRDLVNALVGCDTVSQFIPELAMGSPTKPMNYRLFAREVLWPFAAWVRGEGPYATVRSCGGRTTVLLHFTEDEALDSLQLMHDAEDETACDLRHAFVVIGVVK